MVPWAPASKPVAGSQLVRQVWRQQTDLSLKRWCKAPSVQDRSFQLIHRDKTNENDIEQLGEDGKSYFMSDLDLPYNTQGDI